jgi:hypothetical protein
MKSILLGALGGAAVMIPLLVVLLVMPARAAPRPAPTPGVRPVLLAQLDEYDHWTQRAAATYGQTCTAECQEARDWFFIQRPELWKYTAWWRETYLAEHPVNSYSRFVAQRLSPADLRDPATLDRYLSRSAP